VKPQRGARGIAMTPDERDAFLREQLVCRLGTASSDGRPHVSPLWYVWDGEAMWFYSLVRSQRWTDLQRNPRCSAVVDAGEGEYLELRGVEFGGTVSVLGEVPRVGEPVPDLAPVEADYVRRYRASGMGWDGRHAWLRLHPEREYSWDFRKLEGERIGT